MTLSTCELHGHDVVGAASISIQTKDLSSVLSCLFSGTLIVQLWAWIELVIFEEYLTSLTCLLFCFILCFDCLGSLHSDFQMLSAENFLMELLKPFWFGPFFPITTVTEGGKRQERTHCLFISQLTLTLAAYQCLSGSFGEILLTVESVMLHDRENFAGPPTFLLISLLILPFTDMLWLTSLFSPPVTSQMVTACLFSTLEPSKAASWMGYPTWQVLWNTSWQKRVWYEFWTTHIKKACPLKKKKVRDMKMTTPL